MARNRPDKQSKRRVQETSDVRDANGNPNSTSQKTKKKKAPGTSHANGSSRTPPSSGSSSSSRTTVAINSTPSPSNDDLSETALPSTSTPRINSSSRTVTPIVPTRPNNSSSISSTNDSTRINRVLAPLLVEDVENEVQEAAESVPAEIIQQLNTFLQRQEQFNQRLEQRMADFEESQKGREKKRPRRLPKALTANVREVYKSLIGEDGSQLHWDFSKSFDEAENKILNQQILAGVQNTDGETTVSLIKAAMRVHFRTKRRQHLKRSRNEAQEVLRQQRVRSRLNTKKNQRLKALNLSTSMGAEEKERYMEFMTVDYMSSEHSMSESDEELNDEGGYESPDVERPKKKVFSVTTLAWRSPALTQVMHSLDRKLTRRRSTKATNMLVERNRPGIISTRPAPDDANPFALA